MSSSAVDSRADERSVDERSADERGVDERRADGRITVLVITRDRREELLRTLDQLAGLPEQPPVIVVDNASTDGTTAAVRELHPEVTLIASDRNLGAVGRNLAARLVTTPYIAFCDDDSWWSPGSLARAADVLDQHPEVGAVTARIIVEPSGHEDPIVTELRESPIPGPDGSDGSGALPGPALGSILAAATCLRTEAFRAVGGFNPRLWLGGEEELLSADLAARGWWLCFAQEVSIHHQASPHRDSTERRRLGIRNTLWFNWLRRPAGRALLRTMWLARTSPRDRVTAAAFGEAVRGLPWVLRDRRVLPAHVEQRFRLLEEAQRRSTARRYVG